MKVKALVASGTTQEEIAHAIVSCAPELAALIVARLNDPDRVTRVLEAEETR